MDGMTAQPEIMNAPNAGDVLAFSGGSLASFPELYILSKDGIRRLPGIEGRTQEPLWSPEGDRLVFSISDGWTVNYHLREETGAIRALTSNEHYKTQPAWSPDGRYLAYREAGQPGKPGQSGMLLKVMDLSGDTNVQVQASEVRGYRWTPEGQLLVLVVRDVLTLERFNPDGGLAEAVGQAGFLARALTVAFSPDAAWVAYALPAGDESITDPLYIARLDGSSRKQVGTLWMDGSVTWSPDSNCIAFVTLDDAYPALFVYDLRSEQVKRLLLLDTGDESGEILPAAPAWSPNGQRIAVPSFISLEGSAIFMMNADGSNLSQITTPGGLIYDLAWKP